MGFTVEQALNKLAEEGIVLISKTIGSPAFVGVGIDDMSNGGEFTGNVDVEYEVEIDGTGTPDTFKWRKNGSATYEEEAVSITGSAQTLDNGVTITFNATTGHTLADKWTFTARAADPASIQKNMEQVIAVSFVGASSITSGTIDLRLVKVATITISGDWNVAALLGITVKIFTSPDGINWDTEAWADTGLEPAVVAGSSFQKTTNLDTAPKYMRVEVTNLDALSLGNCFVRIVKSQE